MTQPAVRVVLASASPARLATLRGAGIEPEVVPPDVDERSVVAATPAELAELLADRKCAEVADRLESDRRTIVVGGDSVLELDGQPYGKPVNADEAVRRWHSMRDREGVLHSGLSVRLTGGGDGTSSRSAVSSAVVRFADLADDEVEAYVATGEPLGVAGAFTIDGLGGAYVRGIDGDPHTVVGLSLPLLRDLVGEFGIRWHELWRSA